MSAIASVSAGVSCVQAVLVDLCYSMLRGMSRDGAGSYLEESVRLLFSTFITDYSHCALYYT